MSGGTVRIHRPAVILFVSLKQISIPILIPETSFADPHHFIVGPDPILHFNLGMTTGLQTLHGSILSLHTAIVSVHGPAWPHFEPVQLLNFVFDAIRTHKVYTSILEKDKTNTV